MSDDDFDPLTSEATPDPEGEVPAEKADLRAGDDAERSDEVGAPPACGGERRQ